MEFKDTVMGKITTDALVNWNGLAKEDAEKQTEEYGTPENARNNVTYGSEIAAIDGISDVVGLTNEQKEALKEAVYTQEAVPAELADGIKEQISNSTIIDVLSTIHDNWVKDNGNKFDGRMKNYQFVDLKLLDFKEAQADLLFVQPILEACGIEIDMDELEAEFQKEQKEFLKEHGIKSPKDLQERISEGADFYPALEGVTTNKTGEVVVNQETGEAQISDEGVVRKEGEVKNIVDILRDNPEVAEKMARQVAGKINLKELKEKETINPELTPKEALEASDAIAEFENITREDFTRDENLKDGQEQDGEK